jgi:hypothetical protein
MEINQVCFLLAAIHPQDPQSFAPVCYGWCFHHETVMAKDGELVVDMGWMALRFRPSKRPDNGEVVPIWEFPPASIRWQMAMAEFNGERPFNNPDLGAPGMLFRLIWLQPASFEDMKKAEESKPQTNEPSRIIIPKLEVPKDIRLVK